MEHATPFGTIRIRRENPRQEDVARLLAELDAYLEALYPPQSNHILDIEALAAPEVRFFVARSAARALGCGALRIEREGWGEVKRMFVAPQARGAKLGRAILARIEAQALREGLALLRLETGIHQAEALALYRSAGFVERASFGAYLPDPLSLFMEKALGGVTSRA